MCEDIFGGGVRYYIETVARHKEELVAACKRKYPDLNGRCINIVHVAYTYISQGWMPGFIIDPGRTAINRERLGKLFYGLNEESQEIQKAYEMIDTYNPDTVLVFMTLCCSSDNGT